MKENNWRNRLDKTLKWPLLPCLFIGGLSAQIGHYTDFASWIFFMLCLVGLIGIFFHRITSLEVSLQELQEEISANRKNINQNKNGAPTIVKD